MSRAGRALLPSGVRSPGGWIVAPARASPVVLAVLVLLAVGWMAFLVGTFRRSAYSTFWDAGVFDVLTTGSALLVLARGLLVRTERAGWCALGLGLLANAAADLLWAALSSAGEPVFPSVADGLYLLAYPCLYLALILLLRTRVRHLSTSAWLDGLVAGSALAAVAAAATFDRVTAGADGGTLSTAVALAYPVGDLTLLAITVGALALVGWRVDTRWWLLSAAFVVYAVADTIFLFRSAAGSYRQGTWLDALWPAASLLVAGTAWRPSRQLRQDRFAGWPALLPSMASIVGAVGVLWVAAGPRVPRLAVDLASLTLLAAAARFALSFREVSALADSRRQALTDELTGLPNRRALMTAIGQISVNRASAAGLLLIDLDRFKEVNDCLGHHVGDELLIQVAARLRSGIRRRDLLARLGGDEFAVLLTSGDRRPDGGADPVTGSSAWQAAERIASLLAAPFALDDVTLHVAASTGIGLLPEHTTDPRLLLQRADVAMYTAKTAASRIGVYRAEDDPHSKERLKLLEELRASLCSGGIICHFQPKIDLATGAVDSLEALARWQHPTRGLLLPASFLPLVEQAGLMRQLTLAVLDTSLAQLRGWRDQGLDLKVAVNLSPTNLLDADLPEQIGGALVKQDLPGSALQVEITETVLMTHLTRSRQVLDRLRGLGVQTSLDDYGTGYSSLAYLQELAADELKLDRVFVARLVQDPRAAAIVRSTIELAHSLGMKLVAEGVEDAATARTLHRYGCDLAQGYFHCRPLAGPDATRWLVENCERARSWV